MEFSWAKMPKSFENCKNLKIIEFREACLIDKFPYDIGNCLSLQELIYREPIPRYIYKKIPIQFRKKIGITTLPPSIGKISNLINIILYNCHNLRSLPEELSFFPWKKIRLDSSGNLMKNENRIPKPIRDFVLIDWDYAISANKGFDYNNINARIQPDFDQIIDRICQDTEYIQINTLHGLIGTFPDKKQKIIQIMERCVEKLSNKETKEFILNYLNRISPKFKLPQGSIFL